MAATVQNPVLLQLIEVWDLCDTFPTIVKHRTCVIKFLQL